MLNAELGLPRTIARTLGILLAVGVVVALLVFASGGQLGVFERSAAVTALGVATAALVLTQATLLWGMHQRTLRADEHAEGSPYRSLLVVLVVGALVGVLFAATGTQLGAVPIASAITGLGIVVTFLAVTTAGIILLMGREAVAGREAEQRAEAESERTTQRYPAEPAAEARPATQADAVPEDEASPAPARTDRVVPAATVGTLDGTVPAPMVHVDPVEEDQHVLLIEGIGEKYAVRLNAHGIITVPQLRAADPAVVARQVDATQRLVLEWQSMAELMQVRGIGPQSAEILVRAGIVSVEALAAKDPELLAHDIQRLEEDRKVRIQGQAVKAGTTRRWVLAAKHHLDAMVQVENDDVDDVVRV